MSSFSSWLTEAGIFRSIAMSALWSCSGFVDTLIEGDNSPGRCDMTRRKRRFGGVLVRSSHSKAEIHVDRCGGNRPVEDASRDGILMTIKIILEENVRDLDVGLKGPEGVTTNSHTPSLIKAYLAKSLFIRTACRS